MSLARSVAATIAISPTAAAMTVHRMAGRGGRPGGVRGAGQPRRRARFSSHSPPANGTSRRMASPHPGRRQAIASINGQTTKTAITATAVTPNEPSDVSSLTTTAAGCAAIAAAGCSITIEIVLHRRGSRSHTAGPATSSRGFSTACGTSAREQQGVRREGLRVGQRAVRSHPFDLVDGEPLRPHVLLVRVAFRRTFREVGRQEDAASLGHGARGDLERAERRQAAGHQTRLLPQLSGGYRLVVRV